MLAKIIETLMRNEPMVFIRHYSNIPCSGNNQRNTTKLYTSRNI